MSESGGYRTRQRTAILQHFRAHPHAHFTADELCDALHAKGIAIGKSTVYRALDKLEESGTIRRFTLTPGMSACYQYAEGGGELCHAHFHLKCLVCGILYHVDCDHLDELTAHLGAKHNFTVDYAKTVLYGTCDPCRRALSATKPKNES
ncbi:MAG: transcriptional repressor [Ruminococcaceae bacterium]|nr:transcriptional repressor [Oscillospiraceae bacterium]